MNLGAFSISLAVKDLATSRSFYEKLGFTVTGGDDEKYLINPGLGQDTSTVADFTDVRDIRASLLADGIEIANDTDPDGTGPASIVAMDPDGNPILLDQFFPKPGS